MHSTLRYTPLPRGPVFSINRDYPTSVPDYDDQGNSNTNNSTQPPRDYPTSLPTDGSTNPPITKERTVRSGRASTRK
ncbi:hypothetical protein H4R33_005080 [Dimargaris cristalligena]|nr:hypothetical protein H4R33_005080 [Dimargaris cristalligena]